MMLRDGRLEVGDKGSSPHMHQVDRDVGHAEPHKNEAEPPAERPHREQAERDEQDAPNEIWGMEAQHERIRLQRTHERDDAQVEEQGHDGPHDIP